MRLLHAVAVPVAIVLAVATLAPAVRAQSLADVARKEAERRKTVKSQGKVYTDTELKTPSSSETSAPAPAGSDAAAKPAEPPKSDTKKEPDKRAEPAKDQAYWGDRVKGLRGQLDRDQTLADAMQSRINALTTDFVNRDDPAQRAVIERDRQKAVGELDRLKKAVVDDQKAIADLEEEARRAGVPPGWLRP